MTRKHITTLRGEKVNGFSLGLANYDVEQHPEPEIHKNMLDHDELPKGIKQYSDILYVAETHHIFSGAAQGGSSTESDKPIKNRFIFYSQVDLPHLPGQPLNVPNPYLGKFSKKATGGKIWKTGDARVSEEAPTYCGHIINADDSDRADYIVFGPYYILQPSGRLATFFNSYFFIGNLDGINPDQVLLKLEVGFDSPNGWVNLIPAQVLKRGQIKGDGDGIFTTMRVPSPSSVVHGVEQRIYFYGFGYFEFYQNWCYRPRTQ